VQKVFVFWDNSNIFIGARSVAIENEGQDAYYRIRIDFQKTLDLASAGRPLEFALAVGSVPPQLRHVWTRLEETGVKVELFERGGLTEREQAVDQALQVQMLRKAFDYNGHPGTAVLLTGDGKGFFDGVGFHADLERMQKRGWKIEILAWERNCNRRMKEWAKGIGVFIALEDYYESISFTDDENGVIRRAKPLDLTRRPFAS
jgi:hypothetical protein